MKFPHSISVKTDIHTPALSSCHVHIAILCCTFVLNHFPLEHYTSDADGEEEPFVITPQRPKDKRDLKRTKHEEQALKEHGEVGI